LITAVETNIFSVLWAGVAESEGVGALLEDALRLGVVTICPVVYAGLLANPKMTEDNVNGFLRETGIVVQFSMAEGVWVEAGRRYRRYAERRRAWGGGEPKQLLADFIVGAHALMEADQLISLDRGR
jgi:predicted nucleic acid-binding protein